MRRTNVCGLNIRGVSLLLILPVAVMAHHSFAVFFDAERMASIKGVVKEFQFRNPHGMIRLEVTPDGKDPVLWKIETN